MADYRRADSPGETFFFTVVTEGRAEILCSSIARNILHQAIESCRIARPFDLQATVLLPDHIHAIWSLPPDDADFSVRWASIKSAFTRDFPATGGHEQRLTGSRIRARRRGIWQRRFWEHWIGDGDDWSAHLDYIHYNPVKHGLVRCPHEWPYSTFAKWVKRGAFEPDWQCVCGGRSVKPPDFSRFEHYE